MDTVSLPTYFSAPRPAESSTVSVCPFFFLGRSEVFHATRQSVRREAHKPALMRFTASFHPLMRSLSSRAAAGFRESPAGLRLFLSFQRRGRIRVLRCANGQ